MVLQPIRAAAAAERIHAARPLDAPREQEHIPPVEGARHELERRGCVRGNNCGGASIGSDSSTLSVCVFRDDSRLTAY